MPKFAANLSMMYQEHDFLDRFATALEYAGVLGNIRLHVMAGLAQALAVASKIQNGLGNRAPRIFDFIDARGGIRA